MMAHGGNRRKCKKRLQQWGFLMIGGAWRTLRNKVLAEREGFEPPIRLPVCRISSAVLSTTQPPLQLFEQIYNSDFCGMAKSPFATELLPNALRNSLL